MKNRGISQETLKCIACITMLLDHIGAIFVPGYVLRCIGRLSFPIYCFLIAEGAHYTRSPEKYALRMVFLALITELVYDHAFYGAFTWQKQNVMVTLLMGFLAVEAMKKCPNFLLKLLVVVPFALAAEWSRSDYGAEGVLLIAVFYLTREVPYRLLWQFLGMAAIFGSMLSAELLRVGGFSLTLQEMGVLSMIPIALYSGKKRTNSALLQWNFYLFYPAHLLVLYLIKIA